MRSVRFSQVLEVEVWVTIEVPDDYSDSDVEDYVQEFPFEVTVTEASGEHEHKNAEIYVHSAGYPEKANVG
jgi:hypothetical protein